MGNGSHRIRPLPEVARYQAAGSWLFEIVPEHLAGEGNLYVRNRSDSPLRIWLLGSDGQPLFGEDPWRFEPQEGASADKGLRLQYEDKNITMTGRETLKLEVQDLGTLYRGALERIASWRNGSWTIDLGKIGR